MSINKISNVLTNNIQNGAAKAMLYGVGLKDTDFNKYMVGVGSMQFDINPCNKHLGKLQNIAKKSINNSEMVGFNFNTIGVSDGLTNGNSGMHYSLPSRELIADSIETMVNAHHLDGFVLIPGCDKNIPASMMAMGRINRPSILLYGGTMLPGKFKNNNVDIVDAFQSYGQLIENKITPEERENLLKSCCHKSGGSCSGMYTCNTMATIADVMGLTMPYSSSNPASSKNKFNECKSVGNNILHLLDRNIKPKDIITKESFLNAIKITVILGGSTNAVLHLIAIANEFNIKLTLNDFNEIFENTPVLGNLKPHGIYSMNNIHEMGGFPILLKYLLDNNILDGKTNTITGYTLKENIDSLNIPKLKFNNNKNQINKNIIYPVYKPFKSKSHIKVLNGSLSPKGCIAKISGNCNLFEGKAKVFKTEDSMINALEKKQIKKGDVVIITHQGPKGGPGMPEMLKPSSALVGAGLGDHVALITDGRWSGGSNGILVGHIVPEAIDNGPIAFIEDGDKITIDLKNNKIDHHIDTITLIMRKNHKNVNSVTNTNNSYLNKYKYLVSNASNGCITNYNNNNNNNVNKHNFNYMSYH